MPVQHFAQPAASTIDSDQPITEIRWDFGYANIEILESGHLIAQIRDPNVLLSSGVDITANSGDRFVINVKKDVSAGPFAVFRNNTELVGAIPSWGVAPSVAGKLVHVPNDLYQEKLAIRKNLERPVRIAQSWLGFLSLVAIVFSYVSGIGSRFVPPRFLSSLQTPLFSGAISALTFMALALAIQKRTAFFLLPAAQIFTIVQALFVGSDLLKEPVYPHFGGFRLFVSALSLWVMMDCWKTIRSHRRVARETRKQNLIGLSEIEKSTVRDLAAVTAERGHLLAWQRSRGEAQSANTPSTPEAQPSVFSFPLAEDLLPDGTDPFAQETSELSQPLLRSRPSESLAKPDGVLRPATISLQPAALLLAPISSPSALPQQPTGTAEQLRHEPQLESWVPPIAPFPETVATAKPSAKNHPLRGRVRSGP